MLRHRQLTEAAKALTERDQKLSPIEQAIVQAAAQLILEGCWHIQVKSCNLLRDQPGFEYDNWEVLN